MRPSTENEAWCTCADIEGSTARKLTDKLPQMFRLVTMKSCTCALVSRDAINNKSAVQSTMKYFRNQHWKY